MSETASTPPGRVISEELSEWAVVPSVILPLNLEEFLDSGRRFCTLASVALDEMHTVADQFRSEGRTPLLKVDTCPGWDGTTPHSPTSGRSGSRGA